MKQTKFLLGACLALTLAGCSDEVGITADRLPVSGDEIGFGATTGQFTEDVKRTQYGFVNGENASNFTKLDVKWVPGEDQIRVYSPQASNECQSQDYTVMQDGPDGQFYLQKNGEIGVRWGDVSQRHEFYAFYPIRTTYGDDIDGLKNSTVVTANIPTAQMRGEITSTEDTGGGHGQTWHIVNPDMSFAMMAGRGTWEPGDDKNVTLNFTPLVTVLDVYVTGNASTTERILGVSVRSENQAIVGDFTYDVSKLGTGEEPFAYIEPTDGRDDNLAYVDCTDDNGNPIELQAGANLNVRFFLLPRNIDPRELTVSVLLSDGHVLRQPLVTSGNEAQVGSQVLVAGKIVKVFTPPITVGQTSNWMSMIGDDVLFASQLSLPGSKHSFTYGSYASERDNYDDNTGIMQTFQTLDIGQQFDAGIRAFNIKVVTPSPDPLFGSGDDEQYDEDDYEIYVGNGGRVPGSDGGNYTLHDLFDLFKQKLDAAPTECIVLSIDYVSPPGAAVWMRRLQRAIDAWSRQHQREGVGADEDPDYFREVTATTTMGSMRQGIAVMIHYPEANPNVTSQNVNVVANYPSSVQLTDLQQFDVSSERGAATLHAQSLVQVNNPTLDIYPYFITEQYVLNRADLDLIAKKRELARNLFSLIRTNQTAPASERGRHLYVNDLGGFCVVNNASSTGSVVVGTAEVRQPIINPHWELSGTTYTDAREISNLSSLTDFSTLPDPGRGDDDVPNVIDRGGLTTGQGGNNALLAEQINIHALEYINGLVNEGFMPLGVVYLNFAGTDQVTFDRTYNVYGERLPGIIMSNNFKFPLLTIQSTQGGN